MAMNSRLKVFREKELPSYLVENCKTKLKMSIVICLSSFVGYEKLVAKVRVNMSIVCTQNSNSSCALPFLECLICSFDF